MIYSTPKKCPAPDLRGCELGKKGKNPHYKGRYGGNIEVWYPVSYMYNGGMMEGDDWYPGYDVPEPIVPAGYHLYSIAVGWQFNCHPPFETMLLLKNKT